MSKKFINYKVTIWQRLHFNEDVDMKKVVEKLKEGTHIYDIPEEIESELLLETEEFLPPEENDGQPTIEVYDGYNNLIWDN